MKKKHHTPQQIIDKLRTFERLCAEGATVAEAAKQIEVSEQTYYRWRRKYAKMDKPQLKRLKELEKENARLKKLVADQAFDNAILKEVALRESTEPASQAASRPTRATGAGRE